MWSNIQLRQRLRRYFPNNYEFENFILIFHRICKSIPFVESLGSFGPTINGCLSLSNAGNISPCLFCQILFWNVRPSYCESTEIRFSPNIEKLIGIAFKFTAVAFDCMLTFLLAFVLFMVVESPFGNVTTLLTTPQPKVTKTLAENFGENLKK